MARATLRRASTTTACSARDYREHDPRDLPVEPARRADGTWLTVSVRITGREVAARVWKAEVGRVAVYLLDSNCPENAPADQDITHRLYGGDEVKPYSPGDHAGRRWHARAARAGP